MNHSYIIPWGLIGLTLFLSGCKQEKPKVTSQVPLTEASHESKIEVQQPSTSELTQPYKFRAVSDPDAELEYFDEHFDDYFDDPEDGITYPDDIFDFYLD